MWYALRGRDVDPDDFTELTGITPDRVGRRGEQTPGTGIPRADGLWLMVSGAPPRTPLNPNPVGIPLLVSPRLRR